MKEVLIIKAKADVAERLLSYIESEMNCAEYNEKQYTDSKSADPNYDGTYEKRNIAQANANIEIAESVIKTLCGK